MPYKSPIQVNTTNVRSYGTLLQDAVYEDKRDFIRILLELGIDPTAVCEGKQETPMEIAATRRLSGVLKILEEFTEITDKVKLIQMSVLMNSDKPKRSKETFQKILESLTVDLVSTSSIGEEGTLLQKAVSEGTKDFAKILLEFGVDPTAVCEGKTETPMDIAAEGGREEMISLMAEFTEMPDHVKLLYLSMLMYKGEQKAKEREEFKNILSSMSVDLVNNTKVRGYGNLLQDAVVEGKKDFVRVLLEFGADPHANTEDMESSPMEIAMERDNCEVLVVLAGFAEVSAEMKLDFLRMVLENKGEEQYAAEFKKNLEGLSVSEVAEKQLKWQWLDDPISLNMVQFAAVKGKTDLLQLLLDHGLDPEVHSEDSPTALELAADHGHTEAFALLAAAQEIDPDWFKLAQVLVWAMSGDAAQNHFYNWKPNEQFKELLGSIPADQLSKESICGSTLLQNTAWGGNRSAVALLLQHGADPTATTVKNSKLPEHWAYDHNHVGVLVELSKVKELNPEILSSSLGALVSELVQKEEEREWRRKQQDWQKEVVGMLKQQNQLISLLSINSSEAKKEEQDKDAANIFNPFV